jgi:bifunctional UDP-N-acetylglucosamine pyrophosphorylase/glucosamine-1-phosphate N-acetyltransferase
MDFATIILAAGKGKRMKSDLPKVLHPINGRPMVCYVIETARMLGSNKIVLIIGHKKELVISETQGLNVEYVVQEKQLGTGHAVLQCAPIFKDYYGNLLVLSGDVPLLTPHTLQKLIEIQQREKPLASLLTTEMDDPTGYGRVIRDRNGLVTMIVEHKDANEQILKIKEINVGIYIFESSALFQTLPQLKNDNKQGEYYLPDVVKIYVERGEKVAAVLTRNVEETYGINNIEQLKKAEEILISRDVS